ncbi:MAG: FitA-like ribbon-helix-helix domain-containing protein [Dermatophilaceae bacterium]
MEVVTVVAISVRNLDEDVASRLKLRAAQHGRSMETEVRAILTDALAPGGHEEPNLALVIHERFAALGGVDLDLPPRRDLPRAAEFAEGR